MIVKIALMLYSAGARVTAAGASWWMRRKGRWNSESAAQRYGHEFPLTAASHPIWIHASSMGEVRVGAALAHALTERGASILASAMTETGYQLLDAAFPDQAVKIRAPFDLHSAVSSVLDTYKPSALVIVETELWPTLLSCTAERGIPIFIVNGRLSDKSFPKYKNTRWFWRSILTGINRFYMRSQLDADRMIALGVEFSRVENAGSLKSSATTAKSTGTLEMVGRILHPDLNIWIAGSTRPGEEEVIFKAHRELQRRHPHLQLWIAPRHPERFDEVADLIMSMEIPVVRWSEVASGASPSTGILLIDEMGILPELYEYARIAFVGGSLKPFGGHNPMEPAICGVPVIFGPHMDTQRENADLLIQEKLAVVVEDESAIVTEVERALSAADSPEERARRIAAVKLLVSGAVEHVADDLMRRIGVTRPS